jgi:hypothetical protein
MPIPLVRMLKANTWLACAAVVGMLGIFLATGVGQDPLQFFHPPGEYAQILLADPPLLRATIGLDNFFIVFYSAMFVGLALLLLRDGGARGLVLTALGFLLTLALLDMAENFHFLAMISGAQQGSLPSAAEISLQVWESLLKFHVGYLGLFLLGFAIPRRTWQGRLLSDLTLFVQLPVGILIYVVPRPLSVPLVFVRFGFFVSALLLVSGLFAPDAAPRATGSGARA